MQTEKTDGQLQQYLATSSPEVDFALALTRTIESARHNPGHLRDTVYELARVKLLEQAAQADESEVRRLNHALEIAINRVEAFSLREEPLSITPPPSFLLEGPARAAPLPVAESLDDEYEVTRPFPSRRHRPKHKAIRAFPVPPRFFAAATIIAGIFAALVYWQPKLRSAQQSLPTASPQIEAAAPARTPIPPAETTAAKARLSEAMRPPAAPVPSYYGVFALSGGQLVELEPLLIRAPDQRINISAIFNTESRTILPSGQVQFIVFRRDFATNAPNRVSTRVIARVRSNSGDGKPATDTSWAIRSIAYDFRVAPMTENPEMLAIKAENDGFALSPGRYALVLRGQAFDFTVAGPVTDKSQCIEQIQASNGLFYTECKS